MPAANHLGGGRQPDADVEHHGDVGPQGLLDPHRVLRGEVDPGAVVGRSELGSVLGDAGAQREDLIAA